MRLKKKSYSNVGPEYSSTCRVTSPSSSGGIEQKKINIQGEYELASSRYLLLSLWNNIKCCYSTQGSGGGGGREGESGSQTAEEVRGGEEKNKVSKEEDGGEKTKRLGSIRSLSGFRIKQRETSIFLHFLLPWSSAQPRPAALVASQPLLFQSKQQTHTRTHTHSSSSSLHAARLTRRRLTHRPNVPSPDPLPAPSPSVSVSCGAGAATSCWRRCPDNKKPNQNSHTAAACRLALQSGSASYLDQPEAAAV